MNAPKCRVCGEEHWGSEPHRFKVTKSSGPSRTKRITPIKPVSVAELPSTTVSLGSTGVVSAKAATQTRKEYLRAYMREYMRKRRAR